MKKYSSRERTRRVALCGLLIAMMLVLGFVESRIPIDAGIPGIKLGLSNGVLIFAVYMLDLPTAWMLMALKVVLSGLLFGGFSKIMYAIAGGVLSMICMSVLSKVKGMHPVTVSMAGGAMHNIGQVALAMVILHNGQLLYYMAVLILVGLGCGALTGIVADSVMKHLKTIRS